MRSGGHGPVVVLIHGYAETSDSWAPLAAELMSDHTVIVPDLRGIGRSSRPAAGYDKKTQAQDIRAIVTSLGFDRTSSSPTTSASWSPTPTPRSSPTKSNARRHGLPPPRHRPLEPNHRHATRSGASTSTALTRSVSSPAASASTSTASGTTSPAIPRPDDATRDFFTASTPPGGMRAGFAQFQAFAQDAKDNQVFAYETHHARTRFGGEKSFGANEAVVFRNVAVNVREALSNSGHWLMEESPAYTVALIRDYLKDPTAATPSH